MNPAQPLTDAERKERKHKADIIKYVETLVPNQQAFRVKELVPLLGISRSQVDLLIREAQETRGTDHFRGLLAFDMAKPGSKSSVWVVYRSTLVAYMAANCNAS